MLEIKKKHSKAEGSVRVDLVGGTLDLEPINLILPNVVTLNVATSLKAVVEIEALDDDKVIIESKDYDKTYEYKLSELTPENLYYSEYFNEMSFVLQIISLFSTKQGLKVSLKSGAPAGSGLGGSSAMGVTLHKALADLFGEEIGVTETVSKVKGVEGRILNQGIPGYQDYYPALVGGVLCLRGTPGKIEFEQLYSKELKEYLESHITLVYSGISRNSGINNWDVYKKFFDGVKTTREGLGEIASISYQTYLNIKDGNYSELPFLISKEGELRKSLAPGIVPKEVEDFSIKLKEDNTILGIKMCGAGGGGCFILLHSKENKSKVIDEVEKSSYSVLDFSIEEAL